MKGKKKIEEVGVTMVEEVPMVEVMEVGGKEFPRYNEISNVVDESKIGVVGAPTERESREILDANEGADLIREYGFSHNPITARARIVTVMMKLEEMALNGSTKAAKEFLDRTVGSVTQRVAVGSAKFDKVSDEDLLKIATKRVKKSN